MKPSQIDAPFWLKEKRSENWFAPYDPNLGVLHGMGQKNRPKNHIVGEYILIQGRQTEIFLDKTHPMYAELVNERQRSNNADSKST